MTEIIIHAGFHKTGSSSIQHTLAGLDLGDTEYLDWGHINHSMPFLDGFTNGEIAEMKGPQGDPTDPSAVAAIGKLRSGLEKSNAQRIILSAEAFSVAGYQPGLEQMRDILAEYADTIRVVAYIRPVHSLIASDFQQCARAGLRVEMGRNPEYLLRMRMLDQVFGRENVEFRMFEWDHLAGGDVVLDFAKTLDIPVHKENIIRVNEAVSLECVAVARCAALFGEVGVKHPINLEMNYFATNQLQRIGTTKFKIAGDVLARLVQPYAQEIKAVENRLGRCFPESTTDTAGIRSDEDLFMIARQCEDKVIDIVIEQGEKSPRSTQLMDEWSEKSHSCRRTEDRIACHVDTIKRLKMHARAQNQASRAAAA